MFKLAQIEIQLLNKLGLKKEDIFEPKKLSARTVEKDGETTELDAVTYINLRGYTVDNATLSIKIFPELEEPSASFFVSSDTGEIDATTNKKIFDDRQVSSKEFRDLLATRKESLTESIANI